MNHLKIIGLLAFAAVATMAFTTNASATKPTSPTGGNYGVGNTFKAMAGTTKWTGAFATMECANSTLEGKVTASGGAAAEVSVSTLDFTTCKVSVKKAGILQLTGIGTGNEVNGTVKATGTEVEIETSVGICIFTTNGTDLGTFTGGKTATMDISGAIPRTGGSFLCGSPAIWEGSYSVVTPDELWLDS